MVSVKRLSLIILPAVLMLLVAACGDDDPTATPVPDDTPPPADEATATPVPDDTAPPPPADEPPPPEEEEEVASIPCPDPCIVANNFTVEDGKFEFRIGEEINPDGLFGYPNGARVPSIIPGGIIIGPMLVGTTFQFEVIRMSGSRSTKDHWFIVRGLENNCSELAAPDDACVDGPDILYKYSLDGSRATEPWSYKFDIVGDWPISSATADGDDPPEEHGEALFRICEEIDAAGTGCVGGGEPAAFDGTYVVGDFVVEDGKFVLEMGETPYWGYAAEAAIPTIPGLNEIVIGPIQVGEIVSFSRCRQSGSRSPDTIHHMTIDALGIDYNLDDGRRGSDPPGGTIGEPDDGVTCDIGPFTAPGEYLIYDSTDPDGHGVAKIVVIEAMAAAGITYTVETISMEDGRVDLRVGECACWGFAAGDRLKTDEVDIVLSFNVGDTLIAQTIRMSGSRSTKPHNFTVAGLDIDLNLDEAAGGLSYADYEINFTEPGEFAVTDSTDPDAHGNMTLVVSGA